MEEEDMEMYGMGGFEARKSGKKSKSSVPERLRTAIERLRTVTLLDDSTVGLSAPKSSKKRKSGKMSKSRKSKSGSKARKSKSGSKAKKSKSRKSKSRKSKSRA